MIFAVHSSFAFLGCIMDSCWSFRTCRAWKFVPDTDKEDFWFPHGVRLQICIGMQQQGKIAFQQKARENKNPVWRIALIILKSRRTAKHFRPSTSYSFWNKVSTMTLKLKVLSTDSEREASTETVQAKSLWQEQGRRRLHFCWLPQNIGSALLFLTSRPALVEEHPIIVRSRFYQVCSTMPSLVVGRSVSRLSLDGLWRSSLCYAKQWRTNFPQTTSTTLDGPDTRSLRPPLKTIGILLRQHFVVFGRCKYLFLRSPSCSACLQARLHIVSPHTSSHPPTSVAMLFFSIQF